MSDSHEHKSAHFKDKDAMGHIAEVQAQGVLDSAEIHGTEVPGHISAASDACRETALVLLLVWILLVALKVPLFESLALLLIFSCGWAVWKCGRSAWLGWSRLERFHRIMEQEKWEIEHHRPQEREELRALYTIKGFEGKLLEEVLDVLMADDTRLLRVMVEEELNLSLESHEHPLKQGVWALIGSFCAIAICLLAFYLYPVAGMVIGSLLTIGLGAAVSAYFAQNNRIPAIVWNVGLGAAASGIVYFLLQYFLGKVA